MTFGKEQDPVESGRKGAITSNKDSKTQRNRALTRWKNKDYRKKFRLSMRKSKAWSKEHLSKMGKKSRERENRVIESIKDQYHKIFLPQEVCDRIAIKDGKIFFIEVKSLKQGLSPKQEIFKKLTKNRYIVIKSP